MHTYCFFDDGMFANVRAFNVRSHIVLPLGLVATASILVLYKHWKAPSIPLALCVDVSHKYMP